MSFFLLILDTIKFLLFHFFFNLLKVCCLIATSYHYGQIRYFTPSKFNKKVTFYINLFLLPLWNTNKIQITLKLHVFLLIYYNLLTQLLLKWSLLSHNIMFFSCFLSLPSFPLLGVSLFFVVCWSWEVGGAETAYLHTCSKSSLISHHLTSQA